MNRLNRFRPSPAMVVACVALFVAMGGAGYAAATIGSAQIKNNSIRGKDIRNSTITGKDVKNSSLTGKDIKNSSLAGRDVKNNSLTGSDILESRLGTVPTAANAGHANIADSAGSVSSVTHFPVRAVQAAATLGAAPEVQLGTKGPYRFYAKCFASGASVEGVIYIAVSSGQHLFDVEAETGTVFTSTTPETDRELTHVTNNTANSVETGDGDKDFNATNGTTDIEGIVGLNAVKNGDPATGDAPFGGSGNRCLFGGTVFG